MRVAPNLIVLASDADGFGAAIADGLDTMPDSGLSRELSHFHLSLEKYGVTDRGASGDLIEFLDHDGSPKASIILLPNYEPPIAACAVNEILASIVSDNSSELLTVLIPFIMPPQKITQESINSKFAESGVAFFGAEIGLVTNSTQAMLAGIPKPPPSLRINSETLACLLQMIRVIKMPTLLIGTTIKHRSVRAKAHDIQGLNEIGEFLANSTGLCFIKEKVCWREGEKWTAAREPWQALYG